MINPLRLLARAPVAYTSERNPLGMFQGLGRHGKASQLESMGGNSTLFSIINKTSTSTASVDWHLHRVGTQGQGRTCEVCGEENVAHVAVHPALTVLNRPNDFYTRQETIESAQQHIDLTGEGWIVLGRMGLVPSEMWVVRPDRMTVVTDPREFIRGYIYHGPEGEEVPLDRADVLSIRMPNPTDPHRGMGPVQTVAYNLDSARFSADWNRRFFSNGAKPGGIIKLTSTMNDREWNRFKSRWDERHLGVSNAHRVAFLEGGAEWVDTKFTQKDMQFTELARLDKETIREAFGIPKFAVGDVEDVNRATADAAKAWFAESLTVPRLDRWKGMLNNDFLKQFPTYLDRPLDVEFVYTSPVPADREQDREDKKAKVEIYVALVNAGVTPEDAAKQAGLPPMRHTTRQETGAVA